MKRCFGMKSKRQERKQKNSTLVQEPQFKRSEGNRSSTKHRIITTINLDKSIVNLTTNSPKESNVKELSHESKPPPIWKRIFKDKKLSSKCREL